jgi:ribosomal protein L24
MANFSVGDRVVIRFGDRQGQAGEIIGSQPAHVYTVQVEDGPVLFFSGMGLEKEKERVPQSPVET